MKELYNSKEWKSLKGIERAQFLLVLEGLKRGTIIGGNWSSFMDIINNAGLEYKLKTNKHLIRPVVVVAKPEDLAKAHHDYLTLPEKIKGDEYHKIGGWLLGYPECCTEEYIKQRTPEQRKAKKNGQRHLSYKFGQELDALIKANGTYPEIFDYRPPLFTPCSTECPEATKVLSSWKEAIDTLDPQAGAELVYFHRKLFPERLAHKEYLQQEMQRRTLEYRLEQLRRSVG